LHSWWESIDPEAAAVDPLLSWWESIDPEAAAVDPLFGES
jgi:preprotein translocase subunit Sec61beta